MLNLNQIETQIKSGPRLNPAHPTGEAFVMNDLYKALKALGWTSLDKVHPTDRVSLFRLGSATIRRDKAQAPGHWIVEVAGGSYRTDADLETITAEAASFEAQAQEPAPLSPAAQIVFGIKAEYADYPELFNWIDRGLDLYERGVTDFPKYNTRYSPETFYGHRECDCPARAPRAKFGKGCKHCWAQEIEARVKAERKSTAYRRLTDKLEADRARRQATQAGYDAALRPDRINRKAGHSAQFRGIGHL